MNPINADTFIMKLPFGLISRKVGFRFSTLSYSLMCSMYNPPIDLDQIDHLKDRWKEDGFIKLIVGGAAAYAWEHKKKNRVTEKRVKNWINKLRADKRDLFVNLINTAVLNGKVAGSTVGEMAVKRMAVKKK